MHPRYFIFSNAFPQASALVECGQGHPMPAICAMIVGGKGNIDVSFAPNYLHYDMQKRP
jgi:hypothetical protein